MSFKLIMEQSTTNTKFKVGDRVRINQSPYIGYEGRILEEDPNVILDENHPEFDEDAGQFYVVIDGWVSGEWFWASELIKI